MRLCLSVVSVLFAFLLCEAALRLFFPKYQYVAQGHLQPDDMRLVSPKPNIRTVAVHPDTRRRHPFHTNNLGLRQHRNFSDADILSTTTVGVFGDSFVESVTLDAPYVFTEPLDYLLNLDGKFTVLNFGVGGYGPAQSYFTYRSFPAREDLDYVLFVYYGGNDLVDLVNNGLFDLDGGGKLRQREARSSAWWVPFASRLHLTYLALDATGRLAPYVASLSDDLPEHSIFRRHHLSDDLLEHWLEVFGQLIRRWSAEVEESGGRFLVVLLPTQPDYPRVRPLLEKSGVGVVDLNACYASRDRGHRGRAWTESPYSLKDGHWNELGNRLAAACLDDRLRLEAGLPALAEAARDAVLGEYYAAFGSSQEERPAAEGESPRSRESIRRKYQALGGFDPPQALIPGFSLELPDLDKRVFDSTHWDVYIYEDWLLFLKDDCQAGGAASQLFAKATPADASLLHPPRTTDPCIGLV